MLLAIFILCNVHICICLLLSSFHLLSLWNMTVKNRLYLLTILLLILRRRKHTRIEKKLKRQRRFCNCYCSCWRILPNGSGQNSGRTSDTVRLKKLFVLKKVWQSTKIFKKLFLKTITTWYIYIKWRVQTSSSFDNYSFHLLLLRLRLTRFLATFAYSRRKDTFSGYHLAFYKFWSKASYF